jgi:hypothetical protein
MNTFLKDSLDNDSQTYHHYEWKTGFLLNALAGNKVWRALIIDFQGTRSIPKE